MSQTFMCENDSSFNEDLNQWMSSEPRSLTAEELDMLQKQVS